MSEEDSEFLSFECCNEGQNVDGDHFKLCIHKIYFHVRLLTCQENRVFDVIHNRLFISGDQVGQKEQSGQQHVCSSTFTSGH